MKKGRENAHHDEPQLNNSEGAIIFTDAPTDGKGEKQQLAANGIIRMERYLADLTELRKKYTDLAWSEAVVSATAKQIADERVRFTQVYGTFPAAIEDVE